MEKEAPNLIFPKLLNSNFLSLHIIRLLESPSLSTLIVGVPGAQMFLGAPFPAGTTDQNRPSEDLTLARTGIGGA